MSTDVTREMLEDRVARAERAISDGFADVKLLIRQEIQDLKSEQLRDIKLSVDRVERELKDENRLIWGELNQLKEWKNQQSGRSGLLAALGYFATACVGGFVTAVLNWLTMRGVH